MPKPSFTGHFIRSLMLKRGVVTPKEAWEELVEYCRRYGRKPPSFEHVRRVFYLLAREGVIRRVKRAHRKVTYPETYFKSSYYTIVPGMEGSRLWDDPWLYYRKPREEVVITRRVVEKPVRKVLPKRTLERPRGLRVSTALKLVERYRVTLPQALRKGELPEKVYTAFWALAIHGLWNRPHRESVEYFLDTLERIHSPNPEGIDAVAVAFFLKNPFIETGRVAETLASKAKTYDGVMEDRTVRWNCPQASSTSCFAYMSNFIVGENSETWKSISIPP